MARRNVIAIFDDFVVGNTATYTATRYNNVLGQFDRTAIQAVVDQVAAGTTSITVQLEHSSDQRNWSNKNATAEINAAALVTTATNNFTGADANITPSHAYMRLRISLAGTGAQAHVRLYVCQRDEA